MSAGVTAPLVALFTDFGVGDGSVGVMKAVILGIAPGVSLVDLTHDVPPQDIRQGAWMLHTLWRYLPARSVCLAVVDPGVGTLRRPIGFEAAGRLFVGPDNGLFSYVLDATPVAAAVTLDNPAFHLAPMSATFHGRDLFAPAAAHLASGVPLARLGTSVAAETLHIIKPPRPQPHAEGLAGQVLHVDRFGNLITDFGPELAPAVLAGPGVMVRVGAADIVARAATFAAGPADTPFLLLDSSGHLAIAIRGGSAAARLGAGVGSAVLAVGAKLPE